MSHFPGGSAVATGPRHAAPLETVAEISRRTYCGLSKRKPRWGGEPVGPPENTTSEIFLFCATLVNFGQTPHGCHHSITPPPNGAACTTDSRTAFVLGAIVPGTVWISWQSQNMFSSCAICRVVSYSWSSATTNLSARRTLSTGSSLPCCRDRRARTNLSRLDSDTPLRATYT